MMKSTPNRLDIRSNVNGTLLTAAIGCLFCLAYYKLIFLKGLFFHDAIIWYGSFHFFVESLSNGNFPYWNPFMLTGTYFYPSIPVLGLLDPTALVCVVLHKFLSLDLMPLYVYFCLMRLILLVTGAYYLYRYITGSRISAMLAAGVLLFSIAPTYLRQNGIVNTMFLTPFTLFFLLKYLNEIRHPRRYLFLMCFVFFTGWSINIFIPAYFLFNLALFTLVLFALRLIPIAETAKTLFHRNSMGMLGGALVLIILTAIIQP